MNVFLAGATGAIGRPSIRILRARAHRVFAMTRNPDRNPQLWTAGAIPVVVDALEAAPLALALKAIQPDAIIDQLTDLAMIRTPDKVSEALARNAHLRKAGTAHLVAAATAAGVGSFVAQSIAWVYRPGEQPYDEDAPLDLRATGDLGVSVEGVVALEQAVLGARGLQGCVLRYGWLYGPGTGNDVALNRDMPLHVEAAAWAAVLAMEQTAVGIYNVAEPNTHVRTEKVRRDLHWNESLRA